MESGKHRGFKETCFGKLERNCQGIPGTWILPVWSECDLVADRIKYTGFCEKFDILDRDAMTPFYRVEIEVVQDENGVDHNIYSVRKV